MSVATYVTQSRYKAALSPPWPAPDCQCAGSIELAEMTDVVSELFELSGHKRDEGPVSSVPAKCNTKIYKIYPNPLIESNCLFWLERYCWPGSRRAEKIFARLDVDDNGELDENEFVRGCLDDTEFIKLLSGDPTAESEDPSNSGNTFEYDDNVPKLDLWLI